MNEVLLPGGEIVSLIKPQFEAGKGLAPGGVVTDPLVRKNVVDDIVAFGTKELKLELMGIVESPIRGRDKGNIEYLAYWRKSV
jgi:23S rRNA (cytidine1920-2'-O)/16S rRNA (cytidine1409-2'-O)-methyltransferase